MVSVELFDKYKVFPQELTTSEKDKLEIEDRKYKKEEKS